MNIHLDGHFWYGSSILAYSYFSPSVWGKRMSTKIWWAHSIKPLFLISKLYPLFCGFCTNGPFSALVAANALMNIINIHPAFHIALVSPVIPRMPIFGIYVFWTLKFEETFPIQQRNCSGHIYVQAMKQHMVYCNIVISFEDVHKKTDFLSMAPLKISINFR